MSARRPMTRMPTGEATESVSIRAIPWLHLWRALSFLRSYRLPALGALLSLLLVTAATLVTPQFVRLLIDRGISGRSWTWIVGSTLGLIGTALIRGVFNFLQGFLSEKTGQGVAFDIRNDIFAKLQQLSFSFHDQAQTGQLMTRLTSDVDNVRLFVGQGFLTFASSVATLGGAAIVLFVVDWRLALLSLATVPIIVLLVGFFVTRVIPRFRLIQRKLGNLNTVLQENLVGVAIVKAFAREPFERERYGRANREMLYEGLRVMRAMAFAFPTISFVASLGSLAVVWYGGTLVIDGGLSLGNLVAFNTYLSFLLVPVFQLGFTAALLSRAGASSIRIYEVLDAENEVRDRPGAHVLENVQGEVEFDHVSFRYGGQRSNTLDEVSFVVHPGQTAAVVGTTGSGKSTIINLIPRFYDVTGGAVRIDGQDVRDVTLESLRANIGIVLQESVLFGGTIADNIAYGRPEATMEQIQSAARTAQAHDFIMAFPEGYRSIVGERGVTLSGGQRQRISIARTLLLDPRILLLDDATSSVDAETEFRLQMALLELMEGRTSFVIAQRLSTLRNSDVILVLDQGTVAAQGTHEELLESSQLYAEILDSQLLDSLTHAA